MKKEKSQKVLLSGIAMVVLFILWTVAISLIDVQPIGPQNSSVGFATLNGFIHSLTGVHMAIYTVTDWLGLIPLCFILGFALLGLIQLIKRKSLFKVDSSILVLGAFYIVVMAAYLFFEFYVVNYRPVLINGFLEASYPSSTTLLVMCVMPTAVMQLNSRIRNTKMKRAFAFALIAFTAFMVIGRLISGVHWITDIIGGAILSAGLVMIYYVLISGTTPYTIEEVDTAIRYVVPENQTAPINWKEVTTRNFTNILKKFSVTVTKSDREEGTPQGDATLAGAVYGIYKGETLVDKYVTDKNGQFTTKEYVCDDDWTIREITPSEGYLLDTTIHKVGAEPQLYTVEHNQTANDVSEQVMKGNIAIIKHTDDGETKIETPESGATFEIYLKSSGSFDAAEEDERDVIVCDENGFGQTKNGQTVRMNLRPVQSSSLTGRATV